MLQLFRKNLFAFNIFLLVYCIILRSSGFIFDLEPYQAAKSGILAKYLFDWLPPSALTMKILTIVLVLFQAIQINRLTSLNRLTSENSLFPGLFYVLFASFILEFIPMSAPLLANLFIISMIMEVFKQTRNIHLHIDMFNVGFWIGLASLFYLPYILYLIVGIAGVIYLRTYRWVDTIRALMGLLIPYFLLGTALFINDGLSSLYNLHLSNSLAFVDFSFNLVWKDYVTIAIFVFISLITIVMAPRLSSGINIHVRKKINVLILLLCGSILMTFLTANGHLFVLLYLAFPLSILIGGIFLIIDAQFAEILHFFLLAISLSFQYFL